MLDSLQDKEPSSLQQFSFFGDLSAADDALEVRPLAFCTSAHILLL
jgi:hypothetical protein